MVLTAAPIEEKEEKCHGARHEETRRNRIAAAGG
jgi:hypothetical protein